MAFSALPSSPGFQLPQAPRWEGFAEKAIDLIANRKIPDTASMVDKAADQINNILKLHSPEEKAKRQLEMLQLGAMKTVWSDYQAHPEKYQMTAHGPVLIDPLARSERVWNIRQKIATIQATNRKGVAAPAVQAYQNVLKGINDGTIKVKRMPTPTSTTEAITPTSGPGVTLHAGEAGAAPDDTGESDLSHTREPIENGSEEDDDT